MIATKGQPVHVLWFLGVLFFCLAVSGCASYHPRILMPSVTAASFETRSLDSSQLKTFLTHYHRPPKRWPKQYWGLSDLVLVALYESPELAVQRAQWQIARAQVITAGQRPNPRISLFSEHHSMGFNGFLPWTFGFSLAVPIETAGKRGDRIQQARDLASAARFEVGESAWQVRARVRQQFLDLFRAIERVKILKAEVAVRHQIVVQVSQRVMAGESATLALNRVQFNLQRTQLALASAEVHVATARVALAQALGLPMQAIAGTHFDFARLETLPTLQNLHTIAMEKTALLHRLDIRRGLAHYAAAEAALKLQIANQYPNIHLGPGYEWEEGDSRWGLGLMSMVLPLLNQNQGPIAVAKARVREVATHFFALQVRVIGQVSRAVVNYRGALQTLQSAQVLFVNQSHYDRMLDQQFAVGAIGSISMLEGCSASLVAAQRRLVALYHAQQALGVLENALQRPLTGLSSMTSMRQKFLSASTQVCS